MFTLQLERLKKRNEELEERSDTAEYQVASINQEYRKLLQEKDVSKVMNLLPCSCHYYA